MYNEANQNAVVCGKKHTDYVGLTVNPALKMTGVRSELFNFSLPS